jgi:4-amino-4-deoxy-L-arabinose transferase-like glycosyltransferase
LLAAAALVRVALMFPALGKLDDPDNYLTLASSLSDGRGLAFGDHPTAYRPPLYPLVLAPLVAATNRSTLPWAIGALHLAIGLGTVALTRIAVARISGSDTRALIAAAIVAFDPVLVVQSRSVMTETPAALLVAAALAGLSLTGIRGALLGGLAMGLACLCRPSFLPAAALIALASLLAGPGSFRERLGRSVVILVAAGITLLPWAYRNWRVLGVPVVTTTHGGFTLALANNPEYYADVLDGPPGAVWSGPNQKAWQDRISARTAGLGEVEADRVFLEEGLAMIRQRPRDFARASLARWGRFWGLAPAAAVYPGPLRLATAAWTAPLWLMAIAGLLTRRAWRWPAVAAPVLLVALSAVHFVFWTDLRMRAPLVPAIALVAAGAFPGWGDPKARAEDPDQ